MRTAELQYISRQKPGPYVDIDYFVQWAQPGGTICEPQPWETVFPYPGPFIAGGKTYAKWQELTASKTDGQGHFCRDVYGREVFAEWERFPCFDSFDYLHEHRYDRHFCLRAGNALTYVYYKDEQKEIHVTEDVRNLPRLCFEPMQKSYWQG